MPKPYQRRTSTEWLAIVEDQQQSGLSASQYCDQNQLSSASFYKWKQRCSTKIFMVFTSNKEVQK